MNPSCSAQPIKGSSPHWQPFQLLVDGQEAAPGTDKGTSLLWSERQADGPSAAGPRAALEGCPLSHSAWCSLGPGGAQSFSRVSSLAALEQAGSRFQREAPPCQAGLRVECGTPGAVMAEAAVSSALSRACCYLGSQELPPSPSPPQNPPTTSLG